MKANIVFALILFLSFAALFLLVYVSTGSSDAGPEDVKDENNEVCISSDCVLLSAQIINSIDLSVDPCDNFFNFACGNYLKEEITSEQCEKSFANDIQTAIQDEMKELLENDQNDADYFKNIRNFYKACLDTDAIDNQVREPLKELLNYLGGWPLLDKGEEWEEKNIDWFHCIYNLKELGLESDYILKFTTEDVNPAKKILNIKSPSFSLDKGVYKNNDLLKAYHKLMVDVALQFGADTFRAIREFQYALEFEKKLIEISEAINQEENADTMNLLQLMKEFPNIPWLEYFTKIMFPNNIFIRAENVLLANTQILKRLAKFLDATPERTKVNYVVWRVVYSLLPYTPDYLKDLQFEFESLITGTEHRQTRWRQCVDETNKNFPVLANVLYANKYFTQAMSEKIEQIHGHIKKEFLNTINDWQDEEKQYVENACNDFSFIVDFRNEIDEFNMGKIFSKLEIDVKQYLRSKINVSSWIAFLDKVPEYAQEYLTLHNQKLIALPENVILSAYYRHLLLKTDLPEVAVYGKIATIYAQELVASLKSINDHFDLETDCLDAQYDYFNLTDEDVNLDKLKPEVTNEIALLKATYAAYQKYSNRNQKSSLPGLALNQNQLFWTTYSVDRCKKYRPEYVTFLKEAGDYYNLEHKMKLTFSNLDGFLNDFHCPEYMSVNITAEC